MAVSNQAELLGEDDIKDLVEALYPLRSKWKSIGLQIGLRVSELKAIETQYPSLDDRLLEILYVRLKNAEALTLNRVLTALRSETVNESKTADDIMRKFGHSCEYGSILKRDDSYSCSSETDESSSEGDAPVELSVEKKLIHIFKSCFGKLCCQIDNPLDTAAQCQAKGLVSISKMKKIFSSSESKPEKTIVLLSALEKTIKSNPQKIFATARVFVENKSLLNIGREMQMKIAKVCPERTALEFSCDPHLDSGEGRKSILDDTPLSITSTPLLSDVSASSPEVCQMQPSIISTSMSASSLEVSPVLAKYKKYLQAYYKSNELAPADKYIPTPKVRYINLAIIQTLPFKGRDEFTTLHGGVDEILKSKAPIGIKDMFTSNNDGKPIRFILVEGLPGIGKSTFAWELCRRCNEIEGLRDYHIVVLLRLREKWVLKAKSLSDLFRYPYQAEFSEKIAQELDDSQGYNLLLVLDGFDEVSHSFGQDSVIKSVLCRQLLPECTIILTTRPVANHTLESICQPVVDKHVEIIGFAEEERVRYITEVFSREPELQVNFLKYTFLIPHIKSMMYIPLNCAIIAQVYYESQSSRHLAIPRTKTQLYKALTNSLLARYMKTIESNYNTEYTFPEGLKQEHKNMFDMLTKFAFESYHNGKSRKITFYKEDIPEGLVHFGFMNECTEMYASKGVEKSFYFLHLSLQEYLAAWHLTNNYSVQFQISYHRLALDAYLFTDQYCPPIYRGSDKKESVFIHSLDQHRYSLVEPAIFLAGITGFKSPSRKSRRDFKTYTTNNDCRDNTIMIRSLYEAQNPDVLLHWSPGWRTVNIGGRTPYDCYAFSYCLSQSTNEFCMSLAIDGEKDVLLLEIFVKGLKDHRKNTIPRVKKLRVECRTDNTETVQKGLFWLKEINSLTKVKGLELNSKSDLAYNSLDCFIELESLKIGICCPTSWKWLRALNSVKSLKALHISGKNVCIPPPSNWPIKNRLVKFVFDVKFPPELPVCHLFSSVGLLTDSILKTLLRSDQITKIVLPNVSRQSMASVYKILLHCPCLDSLELIRTSLGYDGILYICSALRNNTVLKFLKIHEDPVLLPERERTYNDISTIAFFLVKCVPLPSKISYTDFLLELQSILVENTTLEEITIQCDIVLLFSPGDKYYRWTGLGPLQQFNVRAVKNGISSALKRSFSSSDLTLPETQVYWDAQFGFTMCAQRDQSVDVDFKKLFSKKKEEGKKLFFLPSFTAPENEILQSFKNLDPRLKKCLRLSDPKNVDEWDAIRPHNPTLCLDWVARTYWALLQNISEYLEEQRK